MPTKKKGPSEWLADDETAKNAALDAVNGLLKDELKSRARVSMSGAFIHDAVAAAVKRAVGEERKRCVGLMREMRDDLVATRTALEAQLPMLGGAAVVEARGKMMTLAVQADMLNRASNVVKLRPDFCRDCLDGKIVPAGLKGPRGETTFVDCPKCVPAPSSKLVS